MIEIYLERDEEGMPPDPILMINGIRFLDYDAVFGEYGGYRVSVNHEHDPEVAHRIMDSRFSDISKDIKTITIHNIKNDGYVPMPEIRELIRIEGNHGEIITLRVGIDYSIEDWTYPWSMSDYSNAYTELFKDSIPEGSRYSFGDSELTAEIEFDVTNPDQTIKEKLHECLEYTRGLHKLVAAEFFETIAERGLLASFQFPEPIRVACEQYLIYFVQFLEDLGVPATYDLRHEATRVLFTVTPDDKDEALDYIRQALEVYLQLPTNPGINIPNEYSMAMPVQQMMAQVQHLQSQITLKNAELQFKDATIQMLQYTVQQQRPLLTAGVMGSSLQEVNEQPIEPQKEVFLGGAIAIKKYEGDGFDVDIPLIYRWLKEVFNRSRRQK